MTLLFGAYLVAQNVSLAWSVDTDRSVVGYDNYGTSSESYAQALDAESTSVYSLALGQTLLFCGAYPQRRRPEHPGLKST